MTNSRIIGRMFMCSVCVFWYPIIWVTDQIGTHEILSTQPFFIWIGGFAFMAGTYGYISLLEEMKAGQYEVLYFGKQRVN